MKVVDFAGVKSADIHICFLKNNTCIKMASIVSVPGEFLSVGYLHCLLMKKVV